MTQDKQRGRVERRALWLVPAGPMTAYLATEYGWPAVAQVGWILRERRGPDGRTEQARTTVVTSLDPEAATAATVLALLRGHWAIENGLFRVRDVSYREDLLHARKTAYGLAQVRNVARRLLRRAGFRYVPDGWRALSADLPRALALLTAPP